MRTKMEAEFGGLLVGLGDEVAFTIRKRSRLVNAAPPAQDSSREKSSAASADERSPINVSLNWYGATSGQMINFDKSVVCFSPNVLNSKKDYLVDLFGVKRVECHENYLGLPCFAGIARRGHILKSLDPTEVGSGLDINFYSNNWIPSILPGLVSTPPRLDGLAKASLLRDTSGGWNKELIRFSFLDNEDMTILSIPWSNNDVSEKTYLNFENSGWFTIKSGNRLTCHNLALTRASPSNGFSGWWKKIWSLNLPPKDVASVVRLCSVLPTSKWVPPPRGILKVNTYDALFDKSLQWIGYGDS
uniref:Uncharacterized protein n=1 Tax=Cannabis sativa TaxID=3483 RepID=A0A803NH12_CANSA